MAQKLAPVNLAFPVKGLHEGVGYDIQPPGTTSSAQNVRGFDAIKNRLRGGRRAGLSKYYANAINGSNVIQAISKTVQGTAYISQNVDNSPIVAVDDDFSSYGVTVPTYLGENWVYRDMLSASEGGGSMVASGSQWGKDANGLVFDNKILLTTRYALVPLRFAGPNNITATMRARTRATNANTNTGAAGDCQCVGPFIRGTASCTSYVFACLIRNAADSSVLLQIIYKSYSAGETLLAQSNPITILNSATIIDTMTISLSENLATNVITARLIWPAAGAASANIDETVVTAADTTNNFGQRRQGVGIHLRADFAIGAASAYRTFKRVVTSYYNPFVPPVQFTLDRTDIAVNRYFIPPGVSAVRHDSTAAGTQVVTNGPYDSASIPPGGSVPYLDTSIDTFIGSGLSVAARFDYFIRQSGTAGGGPFDPELLIKGGVSSGGCDLVFALRFDSGFANGIRARVELTPVTATYAVTGVTGTLTVSATKLVANDDSTVYGSTTSFKVPVHKNSTIRVQDNGSVIAVHIDNNTHEFTVTTSDYSTQDRTGAGAREDSIVVATSPNIIRSVVWRQRPPSSAETLPLGSTSTAKLLIASGGTLYTLQDNILSIPTNGAAAVSSERFQVMMQPAYNRTFIVDGNVSKHYNLGDNTVSTWAATSGTLPSNCRLIALYRGRLVLAGKVDDPHNWFMSKLGDPFDWDYSPATPNVLQAVAGNASDAGLVGDIVTALIPISDDCMVIGGDHSINKMTGDPAAGGTIDEVSSLTGIAFGHAWAKSPDNVLFFLGNDGIYRYNVLGGGSPENITKGRIDVRLRGLDLNYNRVSMEWDYIRDALMVLIVPANIANPCRMLVWERRIDAWGEDVYPTSIGPHMMFAYDSPAATDQVFIHGCRDSYLRKIDEAANDDDGQSITSFVRFEPFIAETHLSEVITNSISPILAVGSGIVNLDIYTGQSAEQCVLATTPRVRRTLDMAGRNKMVRQKVRGYAVQLGLSHTGSSRWAMEGLTVEFDGSGMPRREARTDGN